LIERATLPQREQRFENASAMRLALAPFAGQLSHAGRLAAGLQPLALPSAGVPKTVPSDVPPLTMSQLGAARTSLSERAPGLRGPSTGTEMGGGASPYGPPPAYSPAPYASSFPPPQHPAAQPSPPVVTPPRRRRSGLLFASLLVLVVGAGGAVGYAAYLAADEPRVVVPPLPDASSAPTATPESVETISPDNQVPSGGSVSAPPPAVPRAPAAGSGFKPPPSKDGNSGGGSTSTGPVVIGGGGTGIQLPFPLPGGIQIPTALPSSLPLPPGISFPPGIPGLPQPTSNPPSSPASPPTAEPTPNPTPSPRPRRVPQSTKP
jgi:hypothetical protein